ncbi:MAG: ABC transporter substrate-binding protein [Flavobacterium sp. BFFFF1]|uniref:type IX secretion system anionic LPS delivery protein PorZ n=1 Tax=Flavobacterium sp. BFFFF1 TaxID=2015557 RepID=UPI000BDA645A|nr:T9SS type A sorting domain-containing protein [Flavobacterium sp. BFFFF1]OYU81438.1 MAG: ABC transporter substrate-binding protein [Flavobacterium sp. BFFFF1]
MKYFFILISAVFFSYTGFCQENQLWKGYFSYTSIKDLATSPNRIYAGSENSIFSKNLATNEIKTTNTIDGLPSESISSIYHSNAFSKTLIGYQNGLIIVINDADDAILKVVDIINKQIPPNIKKVNHFMEYEGVLYISCDFGVVQYNLNTLQFGDTYFIGNNGEETVVSQTAVFDGKIYAATADIGIRSGDITNPNLNDFSQWSTAAAGSWVGVETFGSNLIGATSSGALAKLQGGTFITFTSLPLTIKDLRKAGDYLLATIQDRVYIYNEQLIQTRVIASSEIETMNVVFNCATMIGDRVFIGTEENGVYGTTLVPSAFQNITPNGPLRNNIFAIAATTENLWASYGDYDVDYNPYPLEYFGVSKFSPTGWLNIPYQAIKDAVGKDVASIVRITPNPADENQVYFSSFHSGLLKFQDDVPEILYDGTNTTNGPEDPPGTGTYRIDGTAFDKSGNLWVTNSIVRHALKVLRPGGGWQSYDLQGVYNNVLRLNIGRLTIDKNGTKWMPTRDDGLIGFNDNGNVFKTIKSGADVGNLQINNVRVATVDNRNQLWIGTTVGLRVLSSVDSFLSEGQLTARPVIIEEEIDGVKVAVEFLSQQFITDIAIDGANNKWIATADAGVFHFSANGEDVLHIFNSSNSPLPSNSVNDIEVNKSTGEVFFATTKGLVSYKGTAIAANDDLKNVLVYPNPVRPEFSGTVKITGLTDKATVKIADIEGSLVYEVVSEGGSIEWDTTAFGKYKVASGVYMIFISTQDGALTTVKKVMIIR